MATSNASSSSSSSGSSDPAAADLDLDQVFTELARGEKTAQALEANLTSLEKKIDDLLASVEKTGRQQPEDASRASPGVLDVAGKS